MSVAASCVQQVINESKPFIIWRSISSKIQFCTLTISWINLFSIEHSKLMYVRMSARSVAVHCCHAVSRADCRGMCGSWAVPRLCSRGPRHRLVDRVNTGATDWWRRAAMPAARVHSVHKCMNTLSVECDAELRWPLSLEQDLALWTTHAQSNQSSIADRVPQLEAALSRRSRAVDTRDSAAALLSAECSLLPMRALRSSDPFGTWKSSWGCKFNWSDQQTCWSLVRRVRTVSHQSVGRVRDPPAVSMNISNKCANKSRKCEQCVCGLRDVSIILNRTSTRLELDFRLQLLSGTPNFWPASAPNRM